MKTCTICRISLDENKFNKNRSRPDGLQSRCRECDRKTAKEGYHTKYKDRHLKRAKKNKKLITTWFIELKKSYKCQKCGDSRWYVLDFHHKDKSTKLDSVSNLRVRGFSKENILEEIKKCDILCANCHREEHYFAALV